MAQNYSYFESNYQGNRSQKEDLCDNQEIEPREKLNPFHQITTFRLS